MAKSPSKAVAVKEPEALPDYLKGYEGPTGLEAFDRSDFKVPRIKLLQALNPEIQEYRGEAFPGEFWISSAKESLGDSFEFIIAISSKRATLWGPRGTGILAQAKDCIHWDKPNQEFTVELKNIGKVTYKTKGTVQESKLLEWGSSNPRDTNSAPAATLSYDFLIYMLPDGKYSPIVFSLYRTGVDTARDLLTTLAAVRLPLQSVKLIAKAVEATKGADSFYKWQFQLNGIASAQEFHAAQRLAKDYANFDVEEERPEHSTDIDVSKVTDI